MSVVETASPGVLTRVAHRIRSVDLLGLVVVVVAMYIVLSVLRPGQFLSLSNQLAILQNAAFFGIVAFAMTLVIVSGEIDISVGSLAALASSALGVFVVKLGLPMWLSLISVLLVAVAIGAGAGAVRTYFGVPTFIATLSLYLALRGAAQWITDNFAIPIDPNQFFYWGTGRLFDFRWEGKLLGIPIAALYFIGMFILIGFIAKFTVFGRSVYAVGGNAKSANLSGIPVRRIKIIVMIISAASATVAGLLFSGQLQSGSSTIAQGLEFQAISAVIIGGAALAGGKGTVTGTFVGVIFIAALLNGMTLLGIPAPAQQVVQGAVVLVAVLVNVWRSRRSALS